MSLLLEALKKAAEDKEKSDLNAANSRQNLESEKTALADETPEVNEALLLQDPAAAEEVQTDQVDSEEELELYLPDDEIVDDDSVELADNDAIESASLSVSGLALDAGSGDNNAQQQMPADKSEHAPLIDKAVSELSGAGRPLPEYNPADARKILAVNQSRYRNTQRMMHYGMYVFAALLFFVASYLYYSAELLDNSAKPVFRPLSSAQNLQTQNQQNNKTSPGQQTKPKPVSANIQAVENKNSTAKTTTKIRSRAETKPKKIAIVKQQKTDPISLLVTKAYRHYQSAEYSEADKIYQQVLLRDNKQRDALLGRAAIAVIAGHAATARQYYQQLLRYYPDDSIARSALVDLTNKDLSAADESGLNLLLRDNPSAAHVHFSLGLLYEKQGRIKESQQSFFNAFALQPRADYAFNLAVMLDKLGQPEAALSYYKKASSLADNSSSYFDEKSVLERIEQLEKK
ncbi:MAG: hypothetical protein OEY36_03715 [Gammaproteobacteria bacterium]|nr:hypothetical protein [Gammaproteobacteria bacterium]